MIKRYKNGKPLASIYSSNEHRIKFDLIDKDAIKIINKLTDNGFETYLVGGAVRDLLLNKIPKDFDIVTSATPRQVHKLIPNSRIIGKRFRLVHVVYGDKIFEVSTFRSNIEHEGSTDNIFGTLEEDATRRDFTINSLYYNIAEQTLIDFNNAMRDFKDHKIHPVIPLSKIFHEDPVRMIRAVKYSVTTGFKLCTSVRVSIKRNASELLRISSSRLTEELSKILNSGYSSKIIKQFSKFGLLVYILPCISVYSKFPVLYQNLENIDLIIKNNKSQCKSKVEQSELYYYLTKSFILLDPELKTPNELYKDIFRQIKILISPNTPPNFEIENAAKKYIKQKFNSKN